MGSEAADLHPTQLHLPMPGMGRRSTSPHAFNTLEAVAQQVVEERKQQEKIVKKEREQMVEMQRKFEAEACRKELQKEQEEKNWMAHENVGCKKEEAQLRELQQQLASQPQTI